VDVQDVVAFEACYAAHRRHVVAYCLRRASHWDAYEAADETFLIAWRRFDDIPTGHERAWLYGVAYHVLGNQHRGARRRMRLDARLRGTREVAPPGPEAQTLRSAELARVRSAYDQLSADDQEVLRLAAWEGLTHTELGIALGCEPSAARQRLHRARTRLAHRLERRSRRAVVTAGERDDA
jgi:RNA polymerase sigma factor (sigma-70 family)